MNLADARAMPDLRSSVNSSMQVAVSAGSTVLSSPCIPTTPSGSAAVASSIVRPEVLNRREWLEDLEEVSLFSIPQAAIISPTPENRAVRYVADKFDREWLLYRAQSRGNASTDLMPGSRGKTGVKGTRGVFMSELPISVFEDIVTLLEVKASQAPEVPIERISVDNSAPVSAEIMDDVKQYWIRKREALGGNVPCIWQMAPEVREETELQICKAAVLGDCPLPFKRRDWAVNALVRKPTEEEEEEEEDTYVRTSKPLKFAGLKQLVQTSKKLSRATLKREQWKAKHSLLSQYELSLLRRCGQRCELNRQSMTCDTSSFLLAADLCDI